MGAIVPGLKPTSISRSNLLGISNPFGIFFQRLVGCQRRVNTFGSPPSSSVLLLPAVVSPSDSVESSSGHYSHLILFPLPARSEWLASGIPGWSPVFPLEEPCSLLRDENTWAGLLACCRMTYRAKTASNLVQSRGHQGRRQVQSYYPANQSFRLLPDSAITS